MCNKNGFFLKFVRDGLKFVPVFVPLNSCVSVNGTKVEQLNQFVA
jgi:hypothetical protein